MDSPSKGGSLGIAVKEKYIENLSKYSKPQLLDMCERQSNLLANKWVHILARIPLHRIQMRFPLAIRRSRLNQLADKGARIKTLHDRIVAEIESRNEMDQAAAIFSDLNIAEKGLKTVTQMEWNGGKMNASDELAGIDSDDDAEDERTVDPLKVIAQSRAQTKIVKVERPEPSLVTAADLEEIKSFAPALEPHALYVCEKDKIVDENSNVKFLPHKTSRSDVHSVAKEKSRVHGKHWEVTAATPPTMRNNEAKVLTLKESIEIERKYKDELKQLQEKNALERLELRKKIISENATLLPEGIDLSDPNKLFNSYRVKESNDDDSDDESFSENSDNGDEPEVGGVSVVAYD